MSVARTNKVDENTLSNDQLPASIGIAGGGSIGEGIRTFDWFSTKLGPVSSWPQCLKTAINIAINSQQAMFVWWGSDFIGFYNDACSSILGPQYSDALGRPAEDIWRENWHELAPQVERVVSTGEAACHEGVLLFSERYGSPEETYYTFSYSPIFDECNIRGLFCTVTEETEQIVNARRLKLLQALSAQSGVFRTIEETCAAVGQCLASNTRDFPFSLLYLLDESGKQAHLANHGTQNGDSKKRFAPETIRLSAARSTDRDLWPLAHALETGKPQLVENLQSTFDVLPPGAWQKPPDCAIVLPIVDFLPKHQSYGLLILGLSPYRPFDQELQGFTELVAYQIYVNIMKVKETDRLELPSILFNDDAGKPFSPREVLLQAKVNLDLFRARQEIAEEKQKLIAIIETSDDFIGLAAPDGKILYINPAGLKMLGWESVEGKIIRDAIYPEDIPLAEALLLKLKRDGSFQHEIRFMNAKTKKPFWIQGNGGIVVDANTKKITSLATVSPNITERKRLDAERLWQSKLMAMIADAQTLFFCRESLYTMFEMPLQQLLDLTQSEYGFIGEILHTPEGQPYLKCCYITNIAWSDETKALWTANRKTGFEFHELNNLFGEVILTGKVVIANDPAHDFRRSKHGRPPGHPALNAFLGIPFYNNDRLVGMAGLANKPGGYDMDMVEKLRPFMDACANIITAYRNRLETEMLANELSVSEARFRAAVNAVQGILWTNNAKGKMEGEQPGWGALTGQSYEEYQGFGWVNAIHPDDRQSSIDAWLEVLQEPKPFFFEHRVLRADGTWGRYSVRAIPVFEPNGSIREWVGVHTDISERYYAEETLKESQERFQTIADDSPVFIFMAREDGQTEFWNKTFLEYTGLSYREALGRSWENIVHPDDLAFILEVYNLAFQVHQQYTVECRFRNKAGEYRWILWQGAPRYLPNGKFAGLMGTGVDIHDRKTVEEALKESESRFRTMADSAPLFVWTSGPDGKLNYVNQTWCEFLGLSAQNVIEYGMRDAVDPADLVEYSSQYGTAMANRAPFSIESRIRQKNGEAHWLLTKGSPLFLPHGELAGYIGTSIDITDRKAMEAQLENRLDNERLIRKIVEAIGQSFDINLILNTVAQEIGEHLKADRIYITRYSSFAGEFIVDIATQYMRDGNQPIDSEDLQWIKQVVRHLTPHAMDAWQEEIFKTLNPDQETAHIFAPAEKLPDNLPTHEMVALIRKYGIQSSLRIPIYYRGMAYGSINISQCGYKRVWTTNEMDFVKIIAEHTGSAIYQAELYHQAQETALKEQQARQEMEIYAKRLEASNKELEQFATIASHDLSEPLRKVQVFSQILASKVPDDGKDYLRRMNSAANRMQILIDDLLTLSRVNRKGQPFKPINLNYIVKTVLDDMQIILRESGAVVSTEPMGIVQADESQIRQLFQNIIGNAVKYHREDVKPFIRISGQPTGSFYEVTIEDNGIGIPAEHIDRIFEPFQRLHGMEKYPGTGMGLAIAKKIIERHGGVIYVKSEPGHGSRFIFTLLAVK